MFGLQIRKRAPKLLLGRQSCVTSTGGRHNLDPGYTLIVEGRRGLIMGGEKKIRNLKKREKNQGEKKVEMEKRGKKRDKEGQRGKKRGKGGIKEAKRGKG